jgi:hypothetical protein
MLRTIDEGFFQYSSCHMDDLDALIAASRHDTPDALDALLAASRHDSPDDLDRLLAEAAHASTETPISVDDPMDDETNTQTLYI